MATASANQTSSSDRADSSETGGNSKDRVSKDMEVLKDAIAQLRKDVMNAIESASGSGGSHQASLFSRATSHLSEIKENGEAKIAALEKSIEENPLAATAIAVGIGFILGKLIGRR